MIKPFVVRSRSVFTEHPSLTGDSSYDPWAMSEWHGKRGRRSIARLIVVVPQYNSHSVLVA